LIRAVLFDAAGTLIELREPVGESYARIAAAHGVTISAWRLSDAFRRVFAKTEPAVFPHAAPGEIAVLEKQWWRGLVRSTFLAADSARRISDFDACFEELWHHFSQPQAWQPRPGSRALLADLQGRGLRTGVVSNFDGRLPAILEGLGLLSHLDAVVLPSDAGSAKPDRRIFDAALERLGVSAAEAVFVGDDAGRDLEGARAAGLAAIDVASLATLSALQIPGQTA
jgi:putative hydrolase of the HAD superfamily